MTATLPPIVEREAPVQPPPAPVVAPSPTPKPVRERLLSLDTFRGLTVAGMLLVNNPGTWSAIVPPLEHAEWHGWTPTDLIFPFFLFIVGITTHLSLSSRTARGDDQGAIVRQILRRGALIFLFGLLLNWSPFFQWGTVDGIPNATMADRFVFRIEHLRIMGVLQRIGLAYIISALLTLRTTLRQQVLIIAGLLYAYWFAMTLLPVPGEHGQLGIDLLGQPGHTLDAWVDRVLLTPNHLWVGGEGLRDPEGLLSTIPASCTAMLGVLAGRWIGQRQRGIHERLAGLFAVGAIGMMLAMMWHWSFPINKSLWTSSYVLFCGGMAAVALATVMWVVDVHGFRAWTKPFVIYGTNPMIAFLGSGLMARYIYSIQKVNVGGKPVALETAIYDTVFASWLTPRVASLAFALSFVALWYAILWGFHRKGIIFKV